jgi:hypothetical protein
MYMSLILNFLFPSEYAADCRLRYEKGGIAGGEAYCELVFWKKNVIRIRKKRVELPTSTVL